MTKSRRHRLDILAGVLVCTGICTQQLVAQMSDTVKAPAYPEVNALSPPTRLAFVQQPTNASVDTRIAPPVTVKLTDNKGASILQAGVSVTLTLTTGSGVLNGTTTRATDGTGVASFDDLSISLTGSKSLTASSSGYQSTTSNAFSITPGVPSRLRIQTQPPVTATAGVPFSPQPVLWVEDAAGNLITGDNSTVVTATRLAGSGTLQGTVTATAVNGIVSFANLSHNVATTISLLFTGGALIPDTSIATQIVPAPAAQLTFIQQPTAAASGAIITPPVTVAFMDAFGNKLTTTGTAVSIALSSGVGTLGGTLTRNSVSGLATFDDLTINLAGSKILTATSGTLTAAKSDSFTIGTGSAQSLAFIQQPTTAAAGAPISPPVTVQVQDAGGNSVAASGLPISLSVLTGSGTLSGPTVQMTDSTGRATFGGVSIDLSGSKTLSASCAGLSPAVSVPFTITPGSAARLRFAQQPTNAQAGVTLTPGVTVELTDLLGNRVAIAGASVSLTLSSGTGVLTGTIPQLTDAAGLATFANLSVNLSGGKRLTASSGGLTPAVSDSFIISAAAPTRLAFTVSPDNGTAGVPFVTQPTVALQDAFGNPVSGIGQTVALAIQINAGGSGTLSGTTSLAIDTATGSAVFSGLSLDKAGVGYTLTATGSTVSTTPGSVISNPFTIAAAAASTVRVENASDGTGTVLAAQNISSGISITVYAVARDQFDNFAGNIPADSWALTNLTGGVMSTDLVAAADRKSATFTGMQTGTAMVLATAAGLNAVPSGVLTVVVAGAPVKINVETAANGTGTVVPPQTIPSGNKLTVYAIGRDAADNFVANIAADAWVLQGTTGGVADGDLVPGADRKSAAFTGRLAGSTRIRATSGSLDAFNSGIVTVIPGPPGSVASIGGTPQSTLVGTPFPAMFTALVRDAAGNPCRGSQVNWSPPPSGASGSFLPGGSAGATDTNGTATSGVFTANTVGGTYSVTATVAGVSTPAVYALTNLVGTPASIMAVAGSPQSTTVNGAFLIALAASVKDSSGNGVDGALVTFRAPGSGPGGMFPGGLLTASVSARNGGVATAPPLVANGVAGSFTVEATVDGVTSPAVFELTNVPGVAGTLTPIAGTPQSTQVGSAFPAALSVKVRDGFGNTVVGVPVTFAAPLTGPGGVFAFGSADSVRTDTSGTAITSPLHANTVAGQFTVYASAPGVPAQAPFFLTNAPGPVSAFSIEAAGGGTLGTQTAQVPFNIRITAADQYGNTATQFTGTVDITSNGVLSQAATPTAPFSDGLLSSHTVALQNAGRFAITARRSGGAETGQTDTFQVVNPSPVVTGLSPSLGRKGETLDVTITGWGFIAGVTSVSFGDRIATSTTVTSLTQIAVTLTIDTAAAGGPRNVVVFNSTPGGGVSTLADGFLVGSNPVPALSAVSPDHAGLLERLILTLSGSNFVNGVTRVAMGDGILVNAVTVNSPNVLTTDVSIIGSATGGARKIAVTNDPPGGGTSDSLDFSVIAPPTMYPLLSAPPDSAVGLDTSLTMRWHPWKESGIQYRLQVSTSPLFITMVLDDSTVTDTARQVTALGRAITYYWRVHAWNGVGRSEDSPARSFRTSSAYPASYALADTIFFPSHELNSTYEPSDYRLIGLPGDSRIPMSSFMTGKNNVDWIVYWDNGAASNYLVSFDASSSFTCTAGRAFWVLHRGPVIVNREVSTAALDSSRCVQVPLHPGWNLIANPFLAPVSWSSVQQANGPGTIADPWSYDGGFTRAASLLPCHGYLYDNADGRPMLRVPFDLGLAKSIPADEQWRIAITLTSGSMVDRTTSFGISAIAQRGRDPLDLRMPRGIAGSPGVYFSRPEWDAGGSVFATDMRPEIDSMEIWPMEVRAGVQGPADLSFDGIPDVPEQYRIELIDDERRLALDLQTKNVYRFTPSMPVSRFRIAVGTRQAVEHLLDDLLPKAFTMEQNFPNPFNPSTTIPIDLPRDAEVSLVIYSTLGEEVRTLYSGPLAAGRHLIRWDGRSNRGRPASSGVYFIRFSNDAGKESVGKMLLLK